MKAKKLSHVVFAVFAILLLGSMSAFAAAPVLPLPPNQIPMFAQPLPQLTLGTGTGIPLAVGSGPVAVNICEFQTTILPPGTFGKGTLAPTTWVWGYEVGAVCPNPLVPVNHSYLGPVVINERFFPTTMTFTNRLPDANVAMVKAYSTSTDQTVIWGDPLSLNAALGTPRIDGTLFWTTPPPVPPESNDCYEAAVNLHLGLIAALPLACLDHYGVSAAGLPLYAAPIPAAVHLHGGEVPAVLDGGPDSWWTPNGIYGHGYYSKNGPADAAAGKAVYVYPNAQEAAPIWFHDHILGATRLNVYAGVAGGYMVAENWSGRAPNLSPGLLSLGLDRNANNTLDLTADINGVPNETLIPLIIQDRQFDKAGQLFFPAAGINPEHPYWIPEFMGDTIAVNGKVWPFLNVQGQRYRFLVLNGSNARAYELGFVDATPNAKGKPPAARVMPTIYVIGNDQGFLQTAKPILPGALPANKLVIMPGERYEIIVDFKGVAGATLNMTNTAGFPYPLGVPPTNWTGTVMQFRVGAAPLADTSFNPATTAVRTDAMVRLATEGGTIPAPGVTIQKTRRLTLNEVLVKAAPLEILVNNTLYEGAEPAAGNAVIAPARTDFFPRNTMGYNTTYYSELPNEGETEIWEFVNLTVDAHPMHPHLVAFQVLNRQAFDGIAYPAAYAASFPGNAAAVPPIPAGVFMPGYGPPLNYNCGNNANQNRGILDPGICVLGGNPDPMLVGVVGPVLPPSPQEVGWKDTVMAPPGMVTRVLVRFAPTDYAANAPADTIGYEFDPGEMHGYVWHCHIIDHEDNEMMRPYAVQTNLNTPPIPGPGVWAGHTFLSGVQY